MRPALSVAALFAALAFAVPAGALETATTRYEVGYNGLSARGSMSVRPSGKHWVVTLKMGNAVASIDQSTVFDLQGNWFKPLGSSRHVDMAVSGKAMSATFNWRTGQATWKGDVKPRRAGPEAVPGAASCCTRLTWTFPARRKSARVAAAGTPALAADEYM